MQILKRGKSYMFVNEAIIEDKLKPIVYEYFLDQFGGPMIRETEDIIIPETIYSSDKEFISHVENEWKNGQGNLGICLVGEKGLGKSLAASIIAKSTGCPIIKVTSSLFETGLFKLINDIEQDVVLFIDEFEKLFPLNSEEYNEKKNDSAINQEAFLSFLDGGSERKNRIMFIITSNSDYKISSFLKNRPSRLKYFKKYDKMENSVIKEIIDHLLEDKSFENDLLENIPYEGLNTDVLIQVIKEINTHKIPYSKFKDFFNFKEETNVVYDLFVLENDTYVKVGKVKQGIYYNFSHLSNSKGKTYRNIGKEIRLQGIEKIEGLRIEVLKIDGTVMGETKGYLEKESFESLKSRIDF